MEPGLSKFVLTPLNLKKKNFAELNFFFTVYMPVRDFLFVLLSLAYKNNFLIIQNYEILWSRNTSLTGYH